MVHSMGYKKKKNFGPVKMLAAMVGWGRSMYLEDACVFARVTVATVTVSALERSLRSIVINRTVVLAEGAP